MKKNKLILTLLFLFSCTIQAQITKGYWMLGGDGRISSTTIVRDDGAKNNYGYNVRIFPNVGYFFADKLIAGATVPLEYNRPKGGTGSISFGLSPFLRYYLLKAENRVNILAQISGGYRLSKTKGNSTTRSNFYSIKTGPVIFLNDVVGFEILAGYRSAYVETTSDHYNYLDLTFGLQIHLKK